MLCGRRQKVACIFVIFLTTSIFLGRAQILSFAGAAHAVEWRCRMLSFCDSDPAYVFLCDAGESVFSFSLLGRW